MPGLDWLLGRDVDSDTEILAWLRECGSTCRMDTDDNSVTDHAGRIHGTEGLRVVDASITPYNVTADLNALCEMIAVDAQVV